MILLILGPTGVAGAECVRQAIADARVKRVVALSRRPLKIQDAKLEVRLHEDYLHYSRLEDIDAAIFALGVSTWHEKDEERYRDITVRYPMALARALGPKRFLYLSGEGADPAGKSPALFGRVKGEAENQLTELLGSHLSIFRPGWIQPVTPREKPFWLDTLAQPLMWIPMLRKYAAVSSVVLAKAMIEAVFDQDPARIYSNAAIWDYVEALK